MKGRQPKFIVSESLVKPLIGCRRGKIGLVIGHTNRGSNYMYQVGFLEGNKQVCKTYRSEWLEKA